MQRLLMITLMSVLLLAGCNDQQDAMRSSLDKISGMIKQSALLAVQAACMDETYRPEMTHAAAILARRAMGGPEMAKIHKMMGQMQEMPDSNMQMKGDMAGKMTGDTANTSQSSEMKLHVDLHDAGEQVFSFLESLDGNHPPACTQVFPASLAASAAILRDEHTPEAIAAAKKLDQATTTILKMKKSQTAPDQVRILALALQRI